MQQGPEDLGLKPNMLNVEPIVGAHDLGRWDGKWMQNLGHKTVFTTSVLCCVEINPASRRLGLRQRPRAPPPAPAPPPGHPNRLLDDADCSPPSPVLQK